MTDPGKTDLRPASERAGELRRRILEAVEAGKFRLQEASEGTTYLQPDGGEAECQGCAIAAAAYVLGSRRATGGECRRFIQAEAVADIFEINALEGAYEAWQDDSLDDQLAHPEFAALGAELRSLAAGPREKEGG